MSGDTPDELECFQNLAYLCKSYKASAVVRNGLRLVMAIPVLGMLFGQEYIGAGIGVLFFAAMEFWIAQKVRQARPNPDYTGMAMKRGIPSLIQSALKRSRFEAAVGTEVAETIERTAEQSRRASAPLVELKFHQVNGPKVYEAARQGLSQALSSIVGQSFLILESALRSGVPVSPSALQRLKSNEAMIRTVADEASRLGSEMPQPDGRALEDLLAKLRAMREVELDSAESGETEYEAIPLVPKTAPYQASEGRLRNESETYPNLRKGFELLRTRYRFLDARKTFGWQYFLYLTLIIAAAGLVHYNIWLYLASLVVLVALNAALSRLIGRKGGQQRSLSDEMRQNAWKMAYKDFRTNRLTPKLSEPVLLQLERCAKLTQMAVAASSEMTVLSPDPAAIYKDAERQISDSALEQFQRCFGLLNSSVLFRVRPEPAAILRLNDAERDLELLAEEAAALTAAIRQSDASQVTSILERVRALQEIEPKEQINSL